MPLGRIQFVFIYKPIKDAYVFPERHSYHKLEKVSRRQHLAIKKGPQTRLARDPFGESLKKLYWLVFLKYKTSDENAIAISFPSVTFDTTGHKHQFPSLLGQLV